MLRLFHTPTISFLPQKQRGVSLLEVLIAVIVLSLGLLGLAGLQMTAMRNNQSAFERTNAIMHIYSLSDILRADIENIRKNNMSSTFLTNEISHWQQNLANQFSATGQLDGCESLPTTAEDPIIQCSISITWNDSLGLNGASSQTLTMQVRI